MNHEDNGIDFDDLASAAAGALMVVIGAVGVIVTALWIAASPDRPARCADAGAEIVACVQEGV
ncbi:hypothetical protein KLEP181_gp60 [Paracoccus phage vB_PmaP_KLEP18-1]|nr:hypothetical protein KLEP181_gp60 [Paracoccus phage vB_PmaP_KLEP18-1]